MYNKYRITVVVLMVVRSSRMQRTRTIAAAIKSIYYARVCYIRAIYFSASICLVLFLPRILVHSHAHPFTRSLFLSLSFFFFLSFILSIVNSSSFSLYHTLYFFFYLYLIIIIIVIIIISIIMYSAESRYCFLP